MAQNKNTNKHNQKFDFFEKVQINDDQNNWGHGIRQEIIGKQGVVFGIAHHQGETKYYIYVHDLDKTYGIADINLESLNRFETMYELIPEFCSHFILFLYIVWAMMEWQKNQISFRHSNKKWRKSRVTIH